MGIVKIKAIPHPDNKNLSLRYVGTQFYATPRTGRDDKTVTGLDENSLDIISLESPKKEQKQKEIKKLRESLEKLLGKDLTPESLYWKDFSIILEDEVTLDDTNPKDQLVEIFLVANRYVAPSLDAMENDDRYENCMYYLYREKEEITRKVSNQLKEDKARSILFSLYETQGVKLKAVASYLFGYDVETEISLEEVYTKLKDFIETPVEKERKLNVTKFLDANDKSTEEILTKQIFDKALRKKFVTSKGNIYRRGEAIYGNNYEEALEFLTLPENSAEFASLRKQVGK